MRDGNKGGMRYVDEVFDNWAGTLSANSTVNLKCHLFVDDKYSE